MLYYLFQDKCITVGTLPMTLDPDEFVYDELELSAFWGDCYLWDLKFLGEVVKELLGLLFCVMGCIEGYWAKFL